MKFSGSSSKMFEVLKVALFHVEKTVLKAFLSDQRDVSLLLWIWRIRQVGDYLLYDQINMQE